jgi:hypothetical protein
MNPTYDGKLVREHVMSVDRLVNEGKIGVINSNIGDNHTICRARDDMLWQFLSQTDAPYLLSIDTDIEFDPWMVYRLIEHDLDFVAGPYAIKDDGPRTRFCATAIDGHGMDPKTGLQKVKEAGTGFNLIKRGVFEKLIELHPELAYEDDQPSHRGITKYALFIERIVGRRLLTEDYSFDEFCIQAGIDIWLDRSFFVIHHGRARYPLGNQIAQFRHDEPETWALMQKKAPQLMPSAMPVAPVLSGEPVAAVTK